MPLRKRCKNALHEHMLSQHGERNLLKARMTTWVLAMKSNSLMIFGTILSYINIELFVALKF